MLQGFTHLEFNLFWLFFD